MQITTMKNIYGDDIKLKDISWNELTKMVESPPYQRTKGKGGIIGGECEWEDCYAFNEEKQEYMRDWNGNKIRRNKKGTRKVKDRCLLCLDADSIDDFENFMSAVNNHFNSWGWRYVMYSTFSATEDEPRYRIIADFSTPVTPSEYKKIAQAMIVDIGEKYFDACSAVPSQLMFLPAWPEYYDREWDMYESGFYNFEIVEGDPIDAVVYLSLIETFPEYYPALNCQLKPKNEENTGKKYQKINRGENLNLYEDPDDPRNKPGIIGEFCRRYSISEVISEFEIPYREVGHNSYLYEYSHGNKPGGHIKKDDTIFYSFHNDDPWNNKADMNAFDMVLNYVYEGDYTGCVKALRKKLNYYVSERTA